MRRGKEGGIFESTSPVGRRCRGGTKLFRGPAGGEKPLTGGVRYGARQAKPEESQKGAGFKEGVGTAVEVTDAVEPFDGEGQANQEPHR